MHRYLFLRAFSHQVSPGASQLGEKCLKIGLLPNLCHSAAFEEVLPETAQSKKVSSNWPGDRINDHILMSICTSSPLLLCFFRFAVVLCRLLSFVPSLVCLKSHSKQTHPGSLASEAFTPATSSLMDEPLLVLLQVQGFCLFFTLSDLVSSDRGAHH